MKYNKYLAAIALSISLSAMMFVYLSHSYTAIERQQEQTEYRGGGEFINHMSESEQAKFKREATLLQVCILSIILGGLGGGLMWYRTSLDRAAASYMHLMKEGMVLCGLSLPLVFMVCWYFITFELPTTSVHPFLGALVFTFVTGIIMILLNFLVSLLVWKFGPARAETSEA
ncbi:MAG: hypothetical protein H6581_20000 [Bacteroidia bacterium]|nr:hypothetical protein [Bacteroidia bacterium]